MADLFKFVIYCVLMTACYVSSQTDPSPIIDVCKQTSPCTCKYNNGDFIDLRPLSNDNNTEPRFKDMPSEIVGSAKYSWNPCHSFDEGNCTNVTMCELLAGAPPSPRYIPIGSLDSAKFDHNEVNGDLQLQYFVYGAENRTAYILLFCDKEEDGQFIVKGEEEVGSGKYFFELRTKHACRATVAPTVKPHEDTLSPGAIIAIIIGTLFGLYFFGGIAFQLITGGEHIIPNYTFWAAVGGSIKSGAVFVFTCGRSQYTEIDGQSNQEKRPINQPVL